MEKVSSHQKLPVYRREIKGSETFLMLTCTKKPLIPHENNKPAQYSPIRENIIFSYIFSKQILQCMELLNVLNNSMQFA